MNTKANYTKKTSLQKINSVYHPFTIHNYNTSIKKKGLEMELIKTMERIMREDCKSLFHGRCEAIKYCISKLEEEGDYTRAKYIFLTVYTHYIQRYLEEYAMYRDKYEYMRMLEYRLVGAYDRCLLRLEEEEVKRKERRKKEYEEKVSWFKFEIVNPL